jgi:hypothetical protein
LLGILARADAGDLDAAATLIRLSLDAGDSRQRRANAARVQDELS